MSQRLSADVIALGAHIVDILVRPVEAIPAGQGGELVEEIKLTAAGTAGGFAIVSAKLGARVRSAGAVGQDALGDMLLALLAKDGVDTSLIVRKPGIQTSASVLPIRLDGSRPAFHVPGANRAYGLDDVPWEPVAAAAHLHVGAPELMPPGAAVRVLAFAREHGVTTSADVLDPGSPRLLRRIADALPHLDYFLPNEEQVCAITGTDDLVAGCRELIARGVGCVAATAGGAGALIVTERTVVRVPAFDIRVVDTTGCGDAFTAGFLRGLAIGLDVEQAGTLGCATAAQVATGLGSDHGAFDMETTLAFAGVTPKKVHSA
jgi:sugar/nucleoside kinase (ribokinase family)